jgi:aminopeptidase N
MDIRRPVWKATWRLAAVLAFPLLLTVRASGQNLDPRWLFPFGDPRIKDQTVEVAPGRIVSQERGSPVSFEAMIGEMEPVPFILIGESHESLPAHKMQDRIIRALFARDARLTIGLEMVAASRQEVLSRWSLGALSDEEFLRRSGWYANWGFHFDYYRMILTFARDNRLPLLALDSPREVVGRYQVRDGEILPGEKRPVPKVDPAEENDRIFLRKSLESSEMRPEIKAAVLHSMFEDLYEAQVSRDTDMGTRAVEAQKKDGRKVIVLVGSGHLMFGLGLSRQIREKSRLTVKSVVPVFIPKGRETVAVSRTLADYIVGIRAEDRPAFPEIGLTFKSPPDPSKLVVAARPEKGAAKGLDFVENDLILSVDGRTYRDVEDLRIYLAGLRWGEEARFRILRRGVERIVIMKIPD